MQEIFDRGWVWNGKYYATREALDKDKKPSAFILKKKCTQCKDHKTLPGGKYLNKSKTQWVCKDCK